MKRIILITISLLALLFVKAQTTKDYAVMIRVVTAESPASITLKWNKDTTCTAQYVYRKGKYARSWGAQIATLSASATEYIDATVSVGNVYEYYVRRAYAARTSHGYVTAGIKVAEVERKGKMLLLVDENYAIPLQAEINQLVIDLIAEGWQVKKVEVSRTATVPQVKSIVTSTYAADKSLKAIYLLGRIPVPYSGAFSTTGGSYYPPDGHPDHGGAWPADLYYGCLSELGWTDANVNDTTPSRKQNDNIPRDGKFDQVYIYSDSVSFQIGRVDLTNMPVFGKSDTALVRQYLNKAHEFKVGNTSVIRRGLIDDNFGAMSGEAFASTAFRDFSVMFADSVFSNRDYLTATKQGNYLFSYGCGGGSYTSASGIGTTTNFNNDSINTTFTACFGSYFGDWDVTNSFLRAPLCEKTTLTNAWSGRPYWMFHPMALGENIGYSARISQNNYSDFSAGGNMGYAYNICPTFIHVALMGDPSLRLHALKPAGSLDAVTDVDTKKINLTWQASPDAEFYVVLRSGDYNSQYKIISSRLDASTLSFTDPNPDHGMNYYQVKAVKLEVTPSGTYYNTSLAVMDSASSTNTTGLNQESTNKIIADIYPNPGSGVFYVGIENHLEEATINCYDITGKWLAGTTTQNGAARFDLTGVKGIIIVHIETGNNIITRKVLVE